MSGGKVSSGKVSVHRNNTNILLSIINLLTFRGTFYNKFHIYLFILIHRFGAFAEVNFLQTQFSAPGNSLGLHYGVNLNTGLGVRNGNFEAHLLGFGAKIGTDGIEINTPTVGVNACSVM